MGPHIGCFVFFLKRSPQYTIAPVRKHYCILSTEPEWDCSRIASAWRAMDPESLDSCLLAHLCSRVSAVSPENHAKAQIVNLPFIEPLFADGF